MATHDVVHALVPVDQLDEVQRILRVRVPAADLTVTTPSAGAYAACDERFRDDLTAARRGGAAGALVGAVLGVAAALLFGDGSLSLLLLLGAGGAAMAAFAGAVVAMQLHEVLDDDPAGTVDVGDDGAHRLVTVRSERHAVWAHRVLARRADVCVLDGVDAIARTDATT